MTFKLLALLYAKDKATEDLIAEFEEFLGDKDTLWLETCVNNPNPDFISFNCLLGSPLHWISSAFCWTTSTTFEMWWELDEEWKRYMAEKYGNK